MTRLTALRLACVTLPAALALSAAQPARAAAPTLDQLHEQWRTAIGHTPRPHGGCFTAAYPRTSWTQVPCVTAPTRPYLPAQGRGGFTVGDGNDYSAVVTGIISSTVGSFPSITGLKTETDSGTSNDYSLQINSQFFKSPTCSGASVPANCLGWQQFVYSNSGYAFMQYWLINYKKSCPSGGWMAYSSDCYRNSNAVRVPVQKLKQLQALKVTGEAVAGGNDTMMFSTKTKAYTTSGSDTVVDLAGYWNASEYNVIGDGGGSQAVFNTGTSITVNIALTDGSTAAPVCKADDGTTGETNNLNLGACTVSGGATPAVKFTESN